MSFIDDVRRTVEGAKAAFGAVRSVAEWYDTLAPLRDAALRGDRMALAELESYANDPAELPATRAAARLLVEEVKVRRTIGTQATRVGLGVYPGQASPLILLGVGMLLLLTWRRR